MQKAFDDSEAKLKKLEKTLKDENKQLKQNVATEKEKLTSVNKEMKEKNKEIKKLEQVRFFLLFCVYFSWTFWQIIAKINQIFIKYFLNVIWKIVDRKLVIIFLQFICRRQILQWRKETSWTTKWSSCRRIWLLYRRRHRRPRTNWNETSIRHWSLRSTFR